jgi:hypothetical protein
MPLIPKPADLAIGAQNADGLAGVAEMIGRELTGARAKDDGRHQDEKQGYRTHAI